MDTSSSPGELLEARATPGHGRCPGAPSRGLQNWELRRNKVCGEGRKDENRDPRWPAGASGAAQAEFPPTKYTKPHLRQGQDTASEIPSHSKKSAPLPTAAVPPFQNIWGCSVSFPLLPIDPGTQENKCSRLPANTDPTSYCYHCST